MLTSQLKEIILNSLDMELYSNLVFFAEKLHCENPKSEEVKYLLAKGYIGEGKYHKAFQILKVPLFYLLGESFAEALSVFLFVVRQTGCFLRRLRR
jgi:hypothetical protein